ncbi:MAG: DUF2330 domain-containing protein [Propionibacteriaceae bacterium]|jgi:hypothetical protein|nr:DUF2330 domain-containing protein [Propionibacteriaceae bacterium]
MVLTGSSRRGARIAASLSAFTLALSGVAAAQVAAPPDAQAGGIIARTDADGDVRLTSEAAIVSLKDGQEQIDLQLSLAAAVPSIGFIVPTPAPATVSVGTFIEFTFITNEMQPQTNTSDEWWRSEPASTASTVTPTADPTRIQLGPVEATALAASDVDGLNAWLAANAYVLPAGATDVLAGYAARGWSFVAMKLTADKPLSGELVPIRLNFAAEEMVYPLLASTAGTGAWSLNLYTIADHRQTVTYADGTSVTHSVTWARQIRNGSLLLRGSYLTAINLQFTGPGAIKGDLRIAQAPSDAEVGTVVENHQYWGLFGIPLGRLLVGFAIGVGVVILVLTLLPSFRRRK